MEVIRRILRAICILTIYCGGLLLFVGCGLLLFSWLGMTLSPKFLLGVICVEIGIGVIVSSLFAILFIDMTSQIAEARKGINKLVELTSQSKSQQRHDPAREPQLKRGPAHTKKDMNFDDIIAEELNPNSERSKRKG